MKTPRYRQTLTPEEFRRLRQLFESALSLPSDKRREYLEAASGGDVLLIEEVDRMLAADVDRLDMPADDRASEHEGRFRAGTIVAKRFRVVTRLGRGGMGDVYRAYDLELEQPVALKFLAGLHVDDRARARLRNEVKLARHISHPNICRVFDIGEADGELFLSMEYIDGEDLASLLKRVGRLPQDKGVEIARKLCVGLAAAHAKGVLHRDFKPANIM